MWIIVGGIVALILGVLGLIEWWLLFLKALAALIPFILVVGGVLAVIVGITSRREKIEEEKEEVIEQSSESDKS
jgi:multisubunit Na+/H+ antiporter MnhG subunit